MAASRAEPVKTTDRRILNVFRRQLLDFAEKARRAPSPVGETKEVRLETDLDERNTRMLGICSSRQIRGSHPNGVSRRADYPAEIIPPQKRPLLIEVDGHSLAKNSPRMAKRPYRRRIPFASTATQSHSAISIIPFPKGSVPDVTIMQVFPFM